MERSKLIEEFKYYLKNQDALVKKYNGKVLIIKNKCVIDACDSDLEAMNKATKEHKLKPGTFIIRKCEEGQDNYTAIFHSRVSFI